MNFKSLVIGAIAVLTVTFNAQASCLGLFQMLTAAPFDITLRGNGVEKLPVLRGFPTFNDALALRPFDRPPVAVSRITELSQDAIFQESENKPPLTSINGVVLGALRRYGRENGYGVVLDASMTNASPSFMAFKHSSDVIFMKDWSPNKQNTRVVKYLVNNIDRLDRIDRRFIHETIFLNPEWVGHPDYVNWITKLMVRDSRLKYIDEILKIATLKENIGRPEIAILVRDFIKRNMRFNIYDADQFLGDFLRWGWQSDSVYGPDFTELKAVYRRKIDKLNRRNRY